MGKYGKGKRRDGLRSSALSDTSEAPSLASHVRRVRVPSQASGNRLYYLCFLNGNFGIYIEDT